VSGWFVGTFPSPAMNVHSRPMVPSENSRVKRLDKRTDVK
jgi:hypothetical protein